MVFGEWMLPVKLAVLFSGIFLWVGMFTGVWKYLQICKSEQAKAHIYIDIAHRSSLLYAPASLILAVLAYLSMWSELINFWSVVANLIFFSLSIAAYILHGLLKDTNNQFHQPHRLGRWSIQPILLNLFMWILILAELVGTGVLLSGAYLRLF